MAGRYDFTLKQGSTHTIDATWKDSLNVPVDLTGYTARMQVRDKDINGIVIMELTTENGGITITPASGEFTIVISALDSDKTISKKCVYDLEMVKDSDVERILEGIIRVSLSVTRSEATL